MGVFRLLLAVCVLIQHAGVSLGNVPWLGGEGAVFVFFAISGFYMQIVLSERYTAANLGKYWWAKFYTARYFRLFPIYIACLLLTILAAAFASNANRSAYPPLSGLAAIFDLETSIPNLLLGAWVVISNLFIFFSEITQLIVVRAGEATLTLSWGIDYQSDFPVINAVALPHGWSLGVELLFYVIAPCLVWMSNRTIILLLIIFSLVKLAPIYLFSSEFQHLGGRLAPFQFVFFLAGYFVGRFRHRLNYPSWLAFLSLAFVLFVLPEFVQGVEQALVAVVIAVIAFPVAFRVTQHSRVDRYVGELSYAFYVFHALCLAITNFSLQRLDVVERGQLFSVVAVLLTLIVSVIATQIEKFWIEPWRNTLSTPNTANLVNEKITHRA